MARCPKCRSQLPPGAALGEVAQCRICAHVFELEDPDAEPSAPPTVPAPLPSSAPVNEPVTTVRAEPRLAERPPPVEPEPPPELPAPPTRKPSGKVPLPAPPYTIGATAFPNGIALDLSWKEDVGAMLRMVFAGLAFLSVVSLFSALSGTYGDHVRPGGFAIHMAITFVLVAICAYVELNRTTVLVAGGGIEVDHSPLPWVGGSRRLSSRQLKVLRVTENVTRTKSGGRIVRYDLEANGAGAPVLRSWSKRETLDYVQLAIERVTQP